MIWLVFGPQGTTKTSFSLDDEIPTDYYEFEPGGWRRAKARVLAHKRDVRLHPFRVPLTSLEDEGEVIISQRGGTAPAPAHALEGWREVWQAFLQEFMKNIKAEGETKQVFDTGTRLWLIIRQSFLQQVQDATGSQREAMDQLRYTEPNSRMNQVMEAPEHFGKDLVIICHEDTVWGTSQVKADGYKEMANVADISLRFRIEDGKPVANIWKMGGASTGIVGMDVKEPTMAKVRLLLACAEQLQVNEMELPDSAEGIIEMGSIFL